MSTAAKSIDILDLLNGLHSSTRRLAEALVKADTQSIFNALLEQTEAMRALDTHGPDSIDEARGQAVRKMVTKIMEVNTRNQDLSRTGLRALRKTLPFARTDGSYQEDGSPGPANQRTRFVTSA